MKHATLFGTLLIALLLEAWPGRAEPSESAAGQNASPQQQAQTQERRARVFGRFGGRIEGAYKTQITPHWFHNNTRFWYRNDLREGKEFILVDASAGTRQRAFDHEKLARSLSKAAGEEFNAARLPFSEIEFSDDEKAITFEAAGKTWKCVLETGECSVASSESKSAKAEPTSAEPERRRDSGAAADGRRRASAVASPDGKWNAFIKEQNVFVRAQPESSNGEGTEAWQLSQDGTEGNGYGRLEWAPDSKGLLAWRNKPAQRKEVHLVRSSPESGGRAQLESRPYALPGDEFTGYQLSLFDPAARKQIRPEVDLFEHEWLSPRVHWHRDGRHFSYLKVDRGHQRLRVIEVDSQTGATRNLVDEKSDTFIWTVHTENLRLELVNWLEKTDEIIYVSERDGWRHLYLVDPGSQQAGKLKPITSGSWVVRGIDQIDEERRQIWFSAGGRNADQDPYFVHHYRVNFDGSGLVALTEANGNHTVQYAPDRKYLIDSYSRVDSPPAHELRRASDGKLVCPLEQADISELNAKGWKPPEIFVAKGRDGKTDIWGLIHRPAQFDPAKKYPVIESIYAGPQGSFVPKSFGGANRFAALTDLGFIVVQIDGMGTANRSKAFHDVCFRNLKDGGFQDRILWMKAAAAKHPELDLTRVGIYGNSAGGQNAAAAVLFHPEFYQVAVASCGCHDNRMDKSSWNEQWMGYLPPDKIWSKEPDNWYSASSNIDNAHRLQGKLFLIVGEMDTNVPPESTMRFVDALIKASKDFELLVIPGAGHGMGGAYGERRLRDFFVHHLLGSEPPNRNQTEKASAGGS
jgi:dienelactone hydrolase